MKMGSGPQQSRKKSMVTPLRIFLCLVIVCFVWIDFQLSFSIEESVKKQHMKQDDSSIEDYLVSSALSTTTTTSSSSSPSPPPSSQSSSVHQPTPPPSQSSSLFSSLQSPSQSQSPTDTGNLTPRVSRLGFGFIHVGKTGGSTITSFLRNGCHSFLPKPCQNVINETVVSKLVEHYYHVPDFHSLPYSKDDSFVMSVRDVYDRTVSAFVYHLPSNVRRYGRAHKIGGTNKRSRARNKIAYICFPSLEKFASLQILGDSEKCNYDIDRQSILSANCTEFACAVIHGQVRIFNHLYFNYRNILLTKFPRAAPARKLYVIRQEFLWDDWARVNAMVGESEGVVGVAPRKNDNDNDNDNDHNEIKARDVSGYGETVRNSRNISETGRRQLCAALTNEYAAYFAILRKAENMNANEFEKAKTIAMRNCPDLEFLSSEPFEPTESEKKLWEPDPDEYKNEDGDQNENPDENADEDHSK